MDIKHLQERYEQLSWKSKDLQNEVQSLQKKVDELTDQKDRLQSRIQKLGKGVEVIKKVVEDLFEENIQQYKGLVEEGLNTIFWDRTYEFDINISSRGKDKTCSLLYRERRGGDWSSWRSIDGSSGGAIQSVVDFISRVFLITKLNRRKFLICDESFTEISSSYVDSFISFLKELSNTLDFRFLLVSHDRRYIQQSDVVYEVDRGQVQQIDNDSTTN